jgi:hypothetical protein
MLDYYPEKVTCGHGLAMGDPRRSQDVQVKKHQCLLVDLGCLATCRTVVFHPLVSYSMLLSVDNCLASLYPCIQPATYDEATHTRR